MSFFFLLLELVQIVLAKYKIGRWILPVLTFLFSIQTAGTHIGLFILINIATLIFIIINIKMINSGFVIDDRLIKFIIFAFVIAYIISAYIGLIIFRDSHTAT